LRIQDISKKANRDNRQLQPDFYQSQKHFVL